MDAEKSKGRIITKLAELPGKTLLDETTLADAIDVCKRTIPAMLERGELPPGVPFAGRKMWSVEKVLAHFEARADRAAAEAERNHRRLEAMTEAK